MNNDYHKKNEGAHKPKQLVEASSPTAHCPEPTARWSYFIQPRTPAHRTQQLPLLGGVTLVRTLTHTGLALAQAETCHGTSGGHRGPGLSILFLLPLITGGSRAQGCGNLGLGSRGYSHGTVWGKPRRVGNKYDKTRVFGGSASLGWNGRVPAGVEGGR